MVLHPNQSADWLVTRVPSFIKVRVYILLATSVRFILSFYLCTIAAARLDLSQLDIRAVLHVVKSVGLRDGVAALLGLCQ